MEKYWRVNLLGPGPRLMKKEFTGPRSHKGWETLVQKAVAVTAGMTVFHFLYPPVIVAWKYSVSLTAVLCKTSFFWTATTTSWWPGTRAANIQFCAWYVANTVIEIHSSQTYTGVACSISPLCGVSWQACQQKLKGSILLQGMLVALISFGLNVEYYLKFL